MRMSSRLRPTDREAGSCTSEQPTRLCRTGSLGLAVECQTGLALDLLQRFELGEVEANLAGLLGARLFCRQLR